MLLRKLASEKMTILSRPYNLCQHLRRKGVKTAAKLRITLCNACQHLRGCDVKITEGISNHLFYYSCQHLRSKIFQEYSGVRIFAYNVCQRSHPHNVKMIASMRITSSSSLHFVKMTK